MLPLKTNRHRQNLSSLAALGVSLLIVGLGVGRRFGFELGLLFLVGAATVASNTAANSILQSSIDARIRGRVSSLYMLALRGGAPLGNLATGLVVAHAGIRSALLANGILGITCHVAQLGYARRQSKGNRDPVREPV